MSRAKTQNVGLFEESELDGIQPTGSPWIISNDDPATVPVPLQTVIVKVEGQYTERDRKLWVFLLHAVFDELGNKGIHSLPVRDINAVFRKLGGDHGTNWLWESAKRLAKTTIEWEYTLGDERVQGVSSLFEAQVHKKARETGTLNFAFPQLLVPIIKDPSRFARLRVHFLLKLSGKYAVTLYELLEGYVNRRDGQCRVSIEELRTWLKVPSGSYQNWKDFRKWVLDPALKQINDDPLGAGFSVEYEPIRKGRFYHEIVFHLTKTPKRIQSDKLIKLASGDAKTIRTAKEKQRPALLDADVNRAAQETRYYLDMDEVQKQFWSHWESTGKPNFKKGVAQAFIGFTKKKYGQVKHGKR
jgi:Initiator Rep protein, WH2/Initiator Replication protein, WH1